MPDAPSSPTPPRLIGRLGDLERRERRSGEQCLADALARWSLAGNHEWLVDGVRRGEPFLQISTAPADSVLAWEIAQLRQEGYVGIGPFWVPVRWLRDGEAYRRVVRLVADHVLALPHGGEPVFVPKARAELEPLLAMWPFVLVLPSSAALSIDDLIAARAWPVHPLGVVKGPSLADGRVSSPAEFFCHDVDHARFKVREDLLARGVAIADAYVDGSTFDSARGEHRAILPAAVPHVDATFFCVAAARAARVDAWLDAIANEPDRDLAAAARWLLFELVHEKSLPIEPTVLVPALATDVHEGKLRRKVANGFFGAAGPDAAVVARLPAGRTWLRSCIEGKP